MPDQQLTRSTLAEQAVLRRLMLAPTERPDVSDRLITEDFAHPNHRLILVTIAVLASADHPTDAVTNVDTLTEVENAESAGGSSYLAEIVGEAPGGVVAPYAKIVRKAADTRRSANSRDRLT